MGDPRRYLAKLLLTETAIVLSNGVLKQHELGGWNLSLQAEVNWMRSFETESNSQGSKLH